jgi:hypothetical protein
MFKLIGNVYAKIKINSLLWSFHSFVVTCIGGWKQIEAGINGGLAFGGQQYCRGGTLYMFVINVA